jgi:hypothetical protein
MFKTLNAVMNNDWDSLQEKANTALEPLELTVMEQNIIIARMKKLAKDPAFNFANALELVHNSYKQQDWERQSTIGDIVRPSVSDRKAWGQYEEFIELAVALLSQYRGVNGDWRTNAFASVPTNDRASMGSMMAAKVGESVSLSWDSCFGLNIITEQYDPGQGCVSMNCSFDSIEDAFLILEAECNSKGYIMAHRFDILNTSKIVYDILDSNADLVDTVTLNIA